MTNIDYGVVVRKLLIVRALKANYEQLTDQPFDRAVTAKTINALYPLLGDEEDQQFKTLIGDFVSEHREKLEDIYSRYAQDQSRCPFLFQPESLLVFWLLEKDPFRLKEAWMEALPLGFLEQLANVWGTTIDYT